MICKQTLQLLQRNILLLLFAGCLLNGHAAAQQLKKMLPVHKKATVKSSYLTDHDSSYYQSFARYITARFYLSQKYTGLELKTDANVSKFRYLPNTSLVMGVGITYQSISLNLGYGFGFLNTDHAKGKTKYLDLQSHIYARKWTIDFFGQFYKGYYLTPKGLASATDHAYYIRPDIHINLLGVSAYRSLNPDQFSYRAALLQNEKQKKSAGSFLVGAEIYYGVIKADSSLVPKALAANYRQQGVKRLEFFKVGPGVGYAHTFVIEKNFFVTGSLCGSISLDHIDQYGTDTHAEKYALNTGLIYRLVAGYSKAEWNANISLVGNRFTVAGATSGDKYLMAAGNVRLTVARTIKPGRMLKRKLHPVDKVIENVQGLTPVKQ
jgi:hypothetical protein